jgi:hypothetical protein
MIKRQSAVQRTGSKQAFREALEEFIRRSGASSLEQALTIAMASLMKEVIPELEKRSNRKVGSVQRPMSRHKHRK